MTDLLSSFVFLLIIGIIAGGVWILVAMAIEVFTGVKLWPLDIDENEDEEQM